MGVKLKITDSLQNLNPETKRIPRLKQITCFENETVSVQLVAENCGLSLYCCKIEVKSKLPARIRRTEYVAGGFTVRKGHDDYILGENVHCFADLLMPLDTNNFCLKGGRNIFRITLGEGEKLPVGEHTVSVSVYDIDGKRQGNSTSFTVRVIGESLPESDLFVTNWMHYDSICNYYKTEAFSARFWELAEAYITAAVRHGINAVYVPLFTPPLDTYVGGERLTVQLVDVFFENGIYSFGFEKLAKFIEMAKRCGVKYYELSHLFTQWGAMCCPKIIVRENGADTKKFGWHTASDGEEYTLFLQRFLPELGNFLKKQGIYEVSFLHISDEPNESCLEIYGKHKRLVSGLLPDLKHIDALSDVSFAQRGFVDIPVASTSSADRFADLNREYWVYYCTSQHTCNLSNRMMSMPHARNRILGFQLYLNGVKGFLHWGYNFYNSYLSYRQINPFVVTDADGSFQSGDSFIVYPADDGVYDSTRFEVFYEAIQDYRALMLLEKYIGREQTVAMLKDEGMSGFTEYPHGSEWLLSMRERINARIEQEMKR